MFSADIKLLTQRPPEPSPALTPPPPLQGFDSMDVASSWFSQLDSFAHVAHSSESTQRRFTLDHTYSAREATRDNEQENQR